MVKTIKKGVLIEVYTRVLRNIKIFVLHFIDSYLFSD